jgi:hypothetical protein
MGRSSSKEFVMAKKKPAPKRSHHSSDERPMPKKKGKKLPMMTIEIAVPAALAPADDKFVPETPAAAPTTPAEPEVTVMDAEIALRTVDLADIPPLPVPEGNAEFEALVTGAARWWTGNLYNVFTAAVLGSFPVLQPGETRRLRFKIIEMVDNN